MKIKKSKILMTAILLVIMLLSVLQITSFAADSDMIVVKENDSEYLVYVNNMTGENFSFAFSNSKDEANLDYKASVIDNEGNHIAYVNEELKNQYFGSQAYVWVKTADDEVVIEGKEITLDGAKTVEQLNQLNGLTKTITVQSAAEDEKITINGEQNKTYYYQFAALTSSEEYDRLLTLVNEVSQYNEDTNVFTRLQAYNELNDLYNSLVANLSDEDWVEAQNLEITKPYGAKQDGKYVLWLRDSDGNLDVQILTAYEKEVTTVSEKANVEHVTSALPYTYDEATILFVALGVVMVAIVAILVFKAKEKKKIKISNVLLLILIMIAIALVVTIGIIISNRNKNDENLKEVISQVNDNIQTDTDAEIPYIEYGGYQVIGTIQISKIDLEYPILIETTEDSLTKSITRFGDGKVNEVGNLCLAGHDYINNSMFGGINKLENGDEIVIMDLYGNKVTYTVFDKYNTDPNDTSVLDSIDSSKREVTLITCTNGNKDRLIIRATEK